jgi:hypothetical protein
MKGVLSALVLGFIVGVIVWGIKVLIGHTTTNSHNRNDQPPR